MHTFEEDMSPFIETKCGHLYHEYCIEILQQYEGNDVKCSICRQRLIELKCIICGNE